MIDDIDFPVSPAWAAFYAEQGLGEVSQEFKEWLSKVTEHQRYRDCKEELPKPVPTRTFPGIGEQDMLTKKQIQKLDQEEKERRNRKPQVAKPMKNPYKL